MKNITAVKAPLLDETFPDGNHEKKRIIRSACWGWEDQSSKSRFQA